MDFHLGVILFRIRSSWRRLLSADRRSLVKQSLDLVSERPGAPAFNPAHLRIELALERGVEVNDLPELSPGQLFTQCVDNSDVWKGLSKSDHVKQIGAAETGTVIFAQLSTQCVDNLLTVSGSLVRENVLANPLSDRPVKPDHLGVHGRSRTGARSLDKLPYIFQ